MLNEKYSKLTKHLNSFGKVIVAFSGGIDSYLLLKASIDSLGKDNVLAVTGVSPSLKSSELNSLSELTTVLNVNHRIIKTEEMDNPDYFNNPSNRCYFCKDELFQKLEALKTELGFDNIIDGTNFDDLSDYRPGYKAARNHNIISPLADLKFNKEEIREAAKELNLTIWDKPSSPCLSSRIPYGQKVTEEKFSMIERAENVIQSFGFKNFRVRHFEFNNDNNKLLKLSKIDIAKDELSKIMTQEIFDDINEMLSQLGYDFVTLDMAGLRSGSLNLKIKMQVING